MVHDRPNYVAQERLETLLERELGLARAASQLARRLPAGPARGSVTEVARCATSGAEVLLEVMPDDYVQRLGRGLLLEWSLFVASKVSIDSALSLLASALRSQDRRYVEALDVVDAPAQHAILFRVRPPQMRAHTRLCQARSQAEPRETSAPVDHSAIQGSSHGA